jgi:hypothetical protein
MALFCIFVSTMRQPAEQALFFFNDTAPTEIYTVPVQFRDMFRGKVGMQCGVAMPQIPPGL